MLPFLLRFPSTNALANGHFQVKPFLFPLEGLSIDRVFAICKSDRTYDMLTGWWFQEVCFPNDIEQFGKNTMSMARRIVLPPLDPRALAEFLQFSQADRKSHNCSQAYVKSGFFEKAKLLHGVKYIPYGNSLSTYWFQRS